MLLAGGRNPIWKPNGIPAFWQEKIGKFDFGHFWLNTEIGFLFSNTFFVRKYIWTVDSSIWKKKSVMQPKKPNHLLKETAR